MLLELRSITKTFGGLVALQDVSLHLDAGEIVAMVGPNGSGKSTLVNLLSGVYRPDAGTIRLNGQTISGRAPSAIARCGVARTFQNPQLFEGLDVVGNVLVGRHGRLSTNILQALIASRGARREEREARRYAVECLRRAGLPDPDAREPQSLSYGERRLLEIARALAAEPDLLLLDEPVAGLSSMEADKLAGLVHELARSGIGILIVEHNMRFVMKLAERIVVLNFGRKIADGPPDAIRRDPDVIEAYLGGSVARD